MSMLSMLKSSRLTRISRSSMTLGITPELHIFSQVVLIILMYLGRVGGLTLIYAVFSGRNKGNAKLPLEKITVG